MRTPRLVMATGNPGKLRELERMLDDLDVDVVSLADLGLASPVEDGDTFEDNALIKARAAARSAGLVALADDSGLQVDALGGAPGVRSARYAGEDADDQANNDKVLAAMAGIPDRRARFVSAVAVVTPDGREWVVRGTMEGHLLDAPDGDGGFGYDPLFLTEGQSVSNGRLSAAEKDRLSHRGHALRAIRPVLVQLLG
ncbi:MAG TPA: RdgB/HAM1 family non-canonical purine NTP pyrophosphatase [Nitriliruptoraceae bacterium]|nr:RdgB/HAM1 family non-canonical purine NTP pyrophosphatase [Nitriliruptoraceae bacterium]